MKLALLRRNFKAWTESEAVLFYNTVGVECQFVNRTPSKVKEYTDPLGRVEEIHPYRDFNFDEDVMVVPGDVQRQTHPMSYGKIGYKEFKYKISTTHTSGWSPWDYLAMVELSKMSRDCPKDAGGCHMINIMNEKFYKYFMRVDWSETVPKYEEYKPIIESLINDQYICLDRHEPSQYWLNSIPKQCITRVDEIGVALNWANFKTKTNVLRIVDKLKKLHDATGKLINIKFHPYLKPSYIKLFSEYDFIKTYTFEEMYKYEFTDKYTAYVVDGTGLGYEVAYRSKLYGDNIDIYYFDGLDADKVEFLGITDMGVVPEVSVSDLILDPSLHSSFPKEVLELTYPYSKDEDISNEIALTLKKYAELCKSNA